MDRAQTLRQAREAIRRDDHQEARRLLEQVLRADPQDETAWLWLSAVAGDAPRERACLERVLRINPANRLARRHLEQLGPTSRRRKSPKPHWVALAAIALLPITLLLLSLVYGCTFHSPLPPPATSTPELAQDVVPQTSVALPRFEPAVCQFRTPPNETVSCGYLIVPEDRRLVGAGESSPTIRLHVAILESHSDNPAPDPLVYLSGGPGGHALDSLEWNMAPFEEVLATRDVIVFDQRGVGYSRPSLDCWEVNALFFETVEQDLGVEEEMVRSVQAATACRERLVKEGIDLSAYNSVSSAADVEDLRLALGYDGWNLLGASYGTRLALTVMRDFPGGVRSAILDSAYPPQVDLYAEWAANAQRAFDLIFQRCAADEACNAAFPQLATVYHDLIEQLDVQPIRVPVVHPLTESMVQWLVKGADMTGLLFELLYDTGAIPWVPKLIYDTYEGKDDYWLLSLMMQSSALSTLYLSEGMYYSVQCGEETRFSALETVVLGNEDVPPWIRNPLNRDTQTMFTICEAWGAREAGPVENEPISSDIPVLVLAGEFDPVTPPAWGRRTAETLTHARSYEFAGVGHGVMRASECARQIAAGFLRDPRSSPDASCLGEIKALAFSTHD